MKVKSKASEQAPHIVLSARCNVPYGADLRSSSGKLSTRPGSAGQNAGAVVRQATCASRRRRQPLPGQRRGHLMEEKCTKTSLC